MDARSLTGLLVAVSAGALPSVAVAGSIDSTFGRSGRVTVQAGTGTLRLTDVLVDDARRIVVGAGRSCGINCVMPTVFAFEPNGRPTPGFSGASAAALRACGVHRFALRAFGALTIASSECEADGQRLVTPTAVLTGLLADGSIDTAFGEPGVGQAKLPDSRLVAAEARRGHMWVLTRRGDVIETDPLGAISLPGSPGPLPSRVGDDSSRPATPRFLALTALGPITGAVAVAPARALAAKPGVGAIASSAEPRPPVAVVTFARNRPSGRRDTRFALADIPLEGAVGRPAVRPDGVVLVVAAVKRAGQTGLTAIRLPRNGRVHTSPTTIVEKLPKGFGAVDSRVAPDIAMGPGGRAVVAFTTSSGRIAVLRLQPNGRLDETFPIATPPIPRGRWLPGARVAVQSDGRILVARGGRGGRAVVTRLLAG